MIIQRVPDYRAFSQALYARMVIFIGIIDFSVIDDTNFFYPRLSLRGKGIDRRTQIGVCVFACAKKARIRFALQSYLQTDRG